ncbi:MAG: hypothetical protein HQK83_15995 [Fibrobacteria bacterium]|nr:hypothetical protein [Fibrobacteria bacterium]
MKKKNGKSKKSYLSLIMRRLVVATICFICIWPAVLLAQKNSGIPEIDSLPLHDWHVKTPPLSYKKALMYSLIPGGGQLYGKRRVRAGFLIALEGILFYEAFVSKHKLFETKNQDISRFTDSASYWFHQASLTGDEEAFNNIYKSIGKARSSLDVKMANLDLKKSEISWALGLHFYGMMDAMEIVYNSRRDSARSLSGNRAFWSGLFFPGGGQIYNRRYGKFGMLWMAIGNCITSAYYRQQMVNYYQKRVDLASFEGASSEEEESLRKKLTIYRKRRNQYFWGMAILHFYSIGDAVVDAMLNDFDTPDKFALGPGSTPFSLMLYCRF